MQARWKWRAVSSASCSRSACVLANTRSPTIVTPASHTPSGSPQRSQHGSQLEPCESGINMACTIALQRTPAHPNRPTKPAVENYATNPDRLHQRTETPTPAFTGHR